MDAAAILQELVANGHSYSSVGNSLSPPVSRQSVRMVALRQFTSRRIMQALADAIGRPVEGVFPEAAHLFDKQNIINSAELATSKSQKVQTDAARRSA
jgi:hypothetical protein